ncbi:MAG: nucleotide exchange factor GrpE [Oceanospirillaceae bacterium]|nr:nucleotide exchange factor GrpE [Oceanospirillaceae bacterium]MCP5335548.1 nucleotide exchange factor GrpE [Oceanospirillaceae bacterium]
MSNTEQPVNDNAEETLQQAPESGAADSPEQARINELETLVVSLKDEMLRVAADAQNVRRRAEQDVEKAHKFGTEKFARELLSVVDNLERAMAAADPANETLKPMLEGLDMTYKAFVDSLKKFSVEQTDPLGFPFDPDLHQAISMVEAPDAEPNSVINVIQKGYTLHGRLLRPALVVVSKSAPKINEQA